MRRSIVFCLLAFLSAMPLSPAVRAESSESIIISIDNPSFRKVVVAVPDFFPDASVSKQEIRDFAISGAAELRRLLQYSGLFKIIAEQAFADGLKQLEKRYKTAKDADWISDLQGLNANDWAQWKAVGAESLTLASLKQLESGALVLSVKTYDIMQRKQLLAKQFTATGDYLSIIRQYADFILETYTGKPGIFNSKLAFVGKRSARGPKQIFIADFDGSNIKQITRGTEPHLSPAWSPDGRYLAFTSFENRSPNIYVFDTKTKTISRITNRMGLDSGANYSHNGQLIAFTGARGGDTDIFVIDRSGANRKRLIQGSGLDVDPKFSPDGSKIAFVSGRFGNPHIFVAEIKWTSDSSVKVIRDKRLTYAGWYNSTPDWSPDSDKIAFGGYDKDIDRYDIFLMNPDGSQLERLTLKSGDNESPSWSPNGQLIVFQSNRIGDSNRKGVPGIWIMNRDGSNQRKLDINIYEAQTPAWSNQITAD